MARDRRKDARNAKKGDRGSEAKDARAKAGQPGKGDRGGEKGGKEDGGEAKQPSKMDRLFWHFLFLIVLFFVCYRFAYTASSPWKEILVVVQFLCPVAAVVLFFRAYPHPLRTMNRKLAAERDNLRRESKKKKRRKRGF